MELLTAKSSLSRVTFKDRWDEEKEVVEVTSISSTGFGIVVDWMYSGQLPDQMKTYSKNSSELWDDCLHAYKAADMLMINKL